MRRAPALDPAAEGAHLRPEMTVLSDLSANVFAALLLILVVLLQVRALADRAAGAAPPPAVEAARDLGAVPHRALRAGDLVAMLKRRDPASPGLGLDLAEGEVAISRGGATEALPAEAGLARIAAAWRDGGGGEPVRLYVFSNRHYREAVARLVRAGAPWTELSVPRALRDPVAEGRWSPEFLALAAHPASLDAFRDGLARLLAASDRIAPGGHAAGRAGAPGGSAAPSGDAPAASLLARLLRWLGLALAALMLLAGAAVVAATEWLVPRGAVGYARVPASSEGRRARRSPSA